MEQLKARQCVEITLHASARMKERCNIKSADRRQTLAQKAFEQGIRLEQASRCEQKYILSHIDEEIYQGRDVVLYQDVLWVFAANKLITALPRDAAMVRNIHNHKAKSRGKALKTKLAQ